MGVQVRRFGRTGAGAWLSHHQFSRRAVLVMAAVAAPDGDCSPASQGPQMTDDADGGVSSLAERLCRGMPVCGVAGERSEIWPKHGPPGRLQFPAACLFLGSRADPEEKTNDFCCATQSAREQCICGRCELKMLCTPLVPEAQTHSSSFFPRLQFCLGHLCRAAHFAERFHAN